MTLDELQKHWKDYTLVALDGAKKYPMRDAFMLCLGPCRGGLLFDTGGPQGAPAYILKCDEHDNCFVKTDWNAPDAEAWEKCGVFQKE